MFIGGPALGWLVAMSTIRILDVVAPTTEELGSVHELALATMGEPRTRSRRTAFAAMVDRRLTVPRLVGAA